MALEYIRRTSNGRTECSTFSIAPYVRGQALREEFTEQIHTYSPGEPNGGIAEDQVRSPIRFGIIQIGQCRCAHVAQQIRRVWHSSPSIAACDKYRADRMHEAGLKGAGTLVVVARILVKERGEDGVRQEVTGASVEKRCSIPFAISRSTLPVPGIGVRRLFDGGTQADADVDNGIESAPCSQREFLFPIERGGITNVAGIEVWDNADQTLLLFSPDLLGRDQIGGANGHLHVCRRNRQ